MQKDSRIGGVSLRSFLVSIASILAMATAGCSGGGGSGAGGAGISVGGSGVKGPLAQAAVTAYAVDPAVSDLKGAELGSGSTNAAAAIEGLSIPGGTSGLVLLEFVADADTIDITTGVAPILGTLTTIVDATRIEAGELVYATPSSTLAVTLALQKAGTAGVYGGDGDGTVTVEELERALEIAGNQVASTFGFGLLDGVDVYETAPLLNIDTDTPAEQAEVAAFRTANEALAAIVQSLVDDAGASVDPDAVLLALASDLSDGAVDGMQDTTAIADLMAAPNFATLVVADPSTLMIPGTNIPVDDADELLAAEVATTGIEVDAGDLADGTIAADPAAAETVPDSDADGIRDDVDNCVAQPNETQVDFDSDDQGDVCDSDDDNDGVQDGSDAFPFDATESVDTDGDGIGNNADPDDDGDNVLDGDDAFPLDETESVDTDGDGVGDNADTDDDGDGVADVDDAFPLDETESTDADGDGTGDNADTDDDGDGVDDAIDNCPLTPNADQSDVDNDGIGDACEAVAPTLWNQFNWNEANWQ